MSNPDLAGAEMLGGAASLTPGAVTRRQVLRAIGAGAAAVGLGGLLEACGGSGSSGSHGGNGSATPATEPDWEQNFADMDDGPLDAEFWSVDTGNGIPSYNLEQETLTDRPENVWVRNGALQIIARREELNGRRYTSGRVNTQDKFTFTHGRVEFDLMSASGIGTWPAAWLLANGEKYDAKLYGVKSADNPWPFQGEIDVFETVGFLNGRIIPDIHTFAKRDINENSKHHKDVPTYDKEFHTYALDKTEDYLAFLVDGVEYWRHNRKSSDPREWPFEQPSYLIINLAMGGTWGGQLKNKYPPDGIVGEGPWKMLVRSVRYYKDIPDTPPRAS